MTKYHIAASGPRPCGATERPCPLGGEHFESIEEAEHSMGQAYEPLSGVSRASLTSSIVSVSPMAGGRYFGAHISESSISEYLTQFRSLLGDKAGLMEANKAARDRGRVYHMTVTSPQETKAKKGSLTPFPEAVKVEYLGVGRATDGTNEAYFVVCRSEEIAHWREENGLEPKDLHVTLGFDAKDVHTESKGIDSLVSS